MKNILVVFSAIVTLLVGAGCGVEEGNNGPPPGNNGSATPVVNSTGPALTCSTQNANTLLIVISGISTSDLMLEGGSQPSGITSLSVTVWNGGSQPSPVSYSGSSATHQFSVSSSVNRFTPWVTSSDGRKIWIDVRRLNVSGAGCRVVDDGTGSGAKVIIR